MSSTISIRRFFTQGRPAILTVACAVAALVAGCNAELVDDANITVEGSSDRPLLGNCTTTVSGIPTAGSVSAGTTINLTAAGSCTSGTPEYAFLVQEPTGLWGTLRGYSATTTYAWDTTNAFRDGHKVMVRVRAQGVNDAFEGFSTKALYTITGGRRYCTGGTVTPSVSTAAAGTTVTLTGASTCPAGAAPENKFMVLDPAGQWRFLRDFGTGTTYNWDTTGWLDGAYTLYTFIRRVGSKAIAGYDVKSSGAFTLTGGAAYCGSATLNATPSGAVSAGTSVSLTAGSTCSSGATAEYKFVDKQPTGRTTTLRDWAASGSYSWVTSASTTFNGLHSLRVLVRRQGSSLNFEGRSAFQYATISGGVNFCTAASASFAPTSPTTTLSNSSPTIFHLIGPVTSHERRIDSIGAMPRSTT